jgi:hypothetical protein
MRGRRQGGRRRRSGTVTPPAPVYRTFFGQPCSSCCGGCPQLCIDNEIPQTLVATIAGTATTNCGCDCDSLFGTFELTYIGKSADYEWEYEDLDWCSTAYGGSDETSCQEGIFGPYLKHRLRLAVGCHNNRCYGIFENQIVTVAPSTFSGVLIAGFNWGDNWSFRSKHLPWSFPYSDSSSPQWPTCCIQWRGKTPCQLTEMPNVTIEVPS